MAEVNEGVQIILARMESNPEEFFGVSGESNKWRWIFSENLREVMSEPEKAAIYEGMKNVRRLEITAKAISTVMAEEKEVEEEVKLYGGRATTTSKTASAYWGGAIPKSEGKRIK